MEAQTINILSEAAGSVSFADHVDLYLGLVRPEEISVDFVGWGSHVRGVITARSAGGTMENSFYFVGSLRKGELKILDRELSLLSGDDPAAVVAALAQGAEPECVISIEED